MRKRNSSGAARMETLESRTLFSASAATIAADAALFEADIHLEALAVKTFVADLQNGVTLGTPGLNGGLGHLATFKADIKAANATIVGDVGAIVVAALDPSLLPGAVSKLTTDIDNYVATFMADRLALSTGLAKHPSLLSDDTQLQLDLDATKSLWQTVKSEFAQLQTDFE